MTRKLKREIDGRDFRIGAADVYERGWERVFAPDLLAPLELEVDIGFGGGEFVIELAKLHPKTAFVGIERKAARVLKTAHRVVRAGVTNLRLLEGNAQSAIEDLFEEASVQTFWINFPDPWPKDRHAARRLVQSDFMHELALRLKPAGRVYLATDDVPYAEQFCEVLAGESILENLYAPEPWLPEVAGRLPTTFELQWRGEGRTVHYFAYARRPSQAQPPAQ